MRAQIEIGRLQQGMSYVVYAESLAAAAAPDESRDEAAQRRAGFTKLNWHRSRRIEKTYQVSEALRAAVLAITEEQIWMVLTEPWCGDSAQNLPYIAKIAACNPKITLRILHRDENLDIMDQFLTAGARGIPKLVAFDNEARERFQWGPRPREAAEIVRQGREAGKAKEAYVEDLHRWYAQDRGQSVEAEFIELLRG